MQIYHVMAGSGLELPYLLEGTKYDMSFLLAASTYGGFKCYRKHADAIRRNAKSLIFDSGVLGFAKQGKGLDWALNGHNMVVAWGVYELQADRVAAVDVPCEPEILKMIGIDVDEAIRITTENARTALYDQHLDGRRIFTVQGWTLDDRKRSLEQLMPIIEKDPDAWIGNGTTCMLRPETGLFKFYDWLCSELPDRHIHAWGIAQAAWLVELEALGVASGDSATAGFASGHQEFIHAQNGKRIKGAGHMKRDSLMLACDMLRNMRALELAFENLNSKVAGTGSVTRRQFSLWE